MALDKSQHETASPAGDFSHLAFTVNAEEFETLRARLAERGAASWTENFTEGDSYYFLDPNGHKLEIAVSNLANRIEDGKKNWGPKTQWFV